MNFLTDILKWLISFRRGKILDKRESTKVLAAELDKLADIMSDVLKVTAADGRLQYDKLPELDLLRKRVWNRWVAILATDGYASADPEVQAKISRCVRISAHANHARHIAPVRPHLPVPG